MNALPHGDQSLNKWHGSDRAVLTLLTHDTLFPAESVREFSSPASTIPSPQRLFPLFPLTQSDSSFQILQFSEVSSLSLGLSDCQKQDRLNELSLNFSDVDLSYLA